MKRSQIFLIVAILILSLIFVSWILFHLKSAKQPPPSPFPQPTSSAPNIAVQNNQIIDAISPDPTAILKPGQKGQFVLFFNPKLNPKNYIIQLKQDLFSSSVQPAPVAIDITYADNLARVSTKDALAPSANYIVLVLKETEVFFQKNYVSDIESPPKVENNNLELKQYLPHQTDHYSLAYVPDQNIYVFSFNVDVNSKESIDKQFDKAKADALTYIKSKNIEPNSLQIEWRYH